MLKTGMLNMARIDRVIFVQDNNPDYCHIRIALVDPKASYRQFKNLFCNTLSRTQDDLQYDFNIRACKAALLERGIDLIEEFNLFLTAMMNQPGFMSFTTHEATSTENHFYASNIIDRIQFAQNRPASSPIYTGVYVFCNRLHGVVDPPTYYLNVYRTMDQVKLSLIDQQNKKLW